MAIQLNDTHYQEEDTTRLFDEQNSSEYDANIVYILEKNSALSEEVKNLKRKHEIQSVRLCEET